MGLFKSRISVYVDSRFSYHFESVPDAIDVLMRCFGISRAKATIAVYAGVLVQ